MLDLVGNPEDRFSHNEAQIILFIWKELDDGCNKNLIKTFLLYMSRVMKKPVFGVSDQVRHNPGCSRPQKMAERLEVSDVGSRGNALCSKNKGADQLRGYYTADLRLCFRICKKPVFS